MTDTTSLKDGDERAWGQFSPIKNIRLVSLNLPCAINFILRGTVQARSIPSFLALLLTFACVLRAEPCLRMFDVLTIFGGTAYVAAPK